MADSRKVRLSGYGVALQMKSTEYKAQDDAKVEGDEDHGADDEDKVDEIEGFVFSRLRSVAPTVARTSRRLLPYSRWAVRRQACPVVELGSALIH